MIEYIEEAIDGYWGPRCDTRDELCHPCHAWEEYDLLCRELDKRGRIIGEMQAKLDRANGRCSREEMVQRIERIHNESYDGNGPNPLDKSQVRVLSPTERDDLCYRNGVEAERARIVGIIEQRQALYEAQGDAHAALLIVGLGFLLNEILVEELK